MNPKNPKNPTRKRSPQTVHHLGCTISPYRNGEWRATIPRPRGLGRVRKAFSTLDDAKSWVDANISTVRTDISDDPPTPGEITDLRAATALLPPGVSLLEAVRLGVAARARAKRLRTISTADAIAAFLREKRGANCRNNTLVAYEWQLRKLPRVPSIASITSDELLAIVEKRGDRDCNAHCKTFSCFFNWAVAKGYVEISPAASLPRRKIDWVPPLVYTAEQVAAILHTAEKKAPSLVPCLAVAAFAGIRTSGVLRLPTDAVSMENGTILVPGLADKLRSGYLVTMRPNLVAWLKKYPFAAWKLTEPSWNLKMKALLREAEVARVRNGFRHSFASHLLALTNDAVFVSSQLGHWHGDVATLLEHYRRIVTPAAAQTYFNILPA